MKKIVLFMLMLVGSGQIKAHKNIDKRSSGNPMFPGWYAAWKQLFLISNTGFILRILHLMNSRFLWTLFHPLIWSTGRNTRMCWIHPQ